MIWFVIAVVGALIAFTLSVIFGILLISLTWIAFPGLIKLMCLLTIVVLLMAWVIKRINKHE